MVEATAVAPLLIEDLAAWLLGTRGGQMSLAFTFLAAGWYSRKALNIGSMLSTAVSWVAFASGVLGALLLLKIIPRINVDRAVSLVQTLVDIAIDVWNAVM